MYIKLKTKKPIGEYIQHSEEDNEPIYYVESLEELSNYTKGVDYELLGYTIDHRLECKLTLSKDDRFIRWCIDNDIKGWQTILMGNK